MKENTLLNKHIGFKIKKRRSSMGFTQADIANLMGITFQQIHKYETGINSISASQLYKISTILKADIKYFYSEYNK